MHGTPCMARIHGMHGIDAKTNGMDGEDGEPLEKQAEGGKQENTSSSSSNPRTSSVRNGKARPLKTICQCRRRRTPCSRVRPPIVSGAFLHIDAHVQARRGASSELARSVIEALAQRRLDRGQEVPCLQAAPASANPVLASLELRVRLSSSNSTALSLLLIFPRSTLRHLCSAKRTRKSARNGLSPFEIDRSSPPHLL